jgi:hypothetical protein
METTKMTETRPLSEIARDIRRNWQNVYFGAKPYLEALYSLDSIKDNYGADDAKSIVMYFLANALESKIKQLEKDVKLKFTPDTKIPLRKMYRKHLKDAVKLRKKIYFI